MHISIKTVQNSMHIWAMKRWVYSTDAAINSADGII